MRVNPTCISGPLLPPQSLRHHTWFALPATRQESISRIMCRSNRQLSLSAFVPTVSEYILALSQETTEVPCFPSPVKGLPEKNFNQLTDILTTACFFCIFTFPRDQGRIALWRKAQQRDDVHLEYPTHSRRPGVTFELYDSVIWLTSHLLLSM